jgi:hypothetical protein
MLTYEKHSAKLVKVLKGGAFAGWLEQSSHRNTGLNSERHTYWSGLVHGAHVSAATLTGLKAKIAKLEG